MRLFRNAICVSIALWGIAIGSGPAVANEAACEYDLDQFKRYLKSQACTDYIEASTMPEERADRLYRVSRDLNLHGNPMDGLPLIEQALELVPAKAKYLQERGYALSDMGDHHPALKDFDTAIALDPDYVLAYENRAFSRGAVGRFEDSLADLTKAIDLDGENTGRLLYRATALVWLGRVEEAEADLDRLNGVSSMDEAVAVQRDLIARLRGFKPNGEPATECGSWSGPIPDMDAASRLFDACTHAFLDATDNTAKASYVGKRAIASMYMGGWKASISDYVVAAGLDPEYPYSHINLAMAHLYAGSSWIARREFEKALELGLNDTGRAMALAGRAEANYNLKEFELAEADAVASMGATPTPLPLKVLGQLAFDRGNLKGAKIFWMQAYSDGIRDQWMLDSLAKVGVADPDSEPVPWD